MKWLNGACVTATLVAVFVVAIAPNLSAGVDVKLFSTFLEMRDLVSDMQSKVPVTSEWAVVYCECKNGKVVALPVRGTAMEVDKIICEKESAANGGCRTEVRVMKIAAPAERVEAYKKKEEAAKRQRTVDEERYRAWRSRQSVAPSTTSSPGSHDTQWMSRDDFYRHKAEEAAAAAAAEKKARKERVDRLRDAAKEKIYRGVLGEPEYVEGWKPDSR